MTLTLTGPPPPLRGLLLLGLALAVVSAEAFGQAAGQGANYQELNELLVAYPNGQSYCMVSTPDGSRLYASEGGTVAFIEADPALTNAVDNFKYPVKRVPVGKQGVVPVKMLYDDQEDLLIIAGGRDGLWIMEGGFDSPHNAAWRVDDKGNQRLLQFQRSRKWCNDLHRVTLGEGIDQREYLLALFAKRDESHLCLYTMQDVRNVADGANPELGSEIAPRAFIKIPANPTPATSTYNYSYAFGMDVDSDYDSGLDKSTANVYLAMGQHGIVRVHLEMPTSGIQYNLDWGPIFGSLSPYANSTNPAIEADLYRDLAFVRDASAVYDPGKLQAKHAPFFLDVAVDDRGTNRHRIYAAVDHLGMVSFDLDTPWAADMTTGFHQEGIKHYVGDDHGKVCARIVEDPPTTSTYPITFARQVEIVPTVVGGNPSAALLVTTHSTSFLTNPGDLSHGRSFDFLGRDLGGVPGYLSAGGFPQYRVAGAPQLAAFENGSGTEYTDCYDLDPATSWNTGAVNATSFVRGGPGVHIFEQQAPDALGFFVCGQVDASKIPASTLDDEYALLRVDYAAGNWPPPTKDNSHQVLARESKYRPGRWTYQLSPDPVHGNLLDVSSNDAGLRADGPTVLELREADGPVVRTPYAPDPDGLPADDLKKRSLDGSFGIVFEPLGAVVRNGFLYRLGQGQVDVPQPGGGVRSEHRWKLFKYSIGADIYNDHDLGSPPRLIKSVYFSAPEEKFQAEGYFNYGGGAVFADYNAYLATLPGNPWDGKTPIFLTYHGTPTGCWVVDFEALIAQIDSPVADGSLIDPTTYASDVLGELTTHPEFWNVPDARDTTVTSSVGFLDTTKDLHGPIFGNVRTMPPSMFTMLNPHYDPEAPANGPEKYWILAVPCLTTYCDDTWTVFDPPNDTWKPESDFHKSPITSQTGFGRLMVRFFDVTNPSEVTKKQFDGQPGSASLRTWTVLGPVLQYGNPVIQTYYQTWTDPQSQVHTGADYRPKGSAANDLDVLEVFDANQVPHYFCFVADLAGSVQVFDITGLTDIVPGPNAQQQLGPGWEHYGVVMKIDTPYASSPTQDAIADGNPANAWSVAVDQVSFQEGGSQVDQILAYVLAARNGIEVYAFDPWGTPRLRLVDTIQTPGEGGMLTLWKGSPAIPDDPHGYLAEPSDVTSGPALLFCGDTRAGFRVFKYGVRQ